MDIPSLSVNLSQVDTASQWGVKVLSQSLNQMEESGEQMIKMMEKSVNPELGQHIDIRV